MDELIKDAEDNLKNIYAEIAEIAYFNSQKVLTAFQNHQVTESDFYGTTGYGYDDLGRDKIEAIYAQIFHSESALVRNQFISGTHAITTALFAILRPGDVMISITGKPYDTLDAIIGLTENPSSLKSFGIKYEQIALKNDDFDYETITKRLKQGSVKLITIQRSKGYEFRHSLSIEQVAKVIKLIKEIDQNICILVDNCYCEFVGIKEPTEVGADLCVGSLIKNLGAGMCSNGAYIVGKKKYITLCGERLNMPGEGLKVGPSLGANKDILKGLYMAPSVVASALKTGIFAAYIMEKMGYEVNPKYNETHSDIVTAIKFNDALVMQKFIQGIQKGSAIDSFVTPMPSAMPGYKREIIMASGSFTQGSSIELSCDGPMVEPYIAYLQGSLTYEYGKLGILTALKEINHN